MKFLLFLSIFLFCGTSFSEDLLNKCPESIETNQDFSGQSFGYKTLNRKKFRNFLVSIDLLYQDPESQGLLIPDSDRKGVLLWEFGPQAEQDSYWLGCGYRDTSVKLYIAISKKYTKCELRYKPENSSFKPYVSTVKKLECF